MSDFLATALGLAFALIVCLLALQAILSPWLRLRRVRASDTNRSDHTQASKSAQRAAQPKTTPVQMV
jgi:uncharacterized membrane protein YcjF (UPF0283 family)